MSAKLRWSFKVIEDFKRFSHQAERLAQPRNVDHVNPQTRVSGLYE